MAKAVDDTPSLHQPKPKNPPHTQVFSFLLAVTDESFRYHLLVDFAESLAQYLQTLLIKVPTCRSAAEVQVGR